MPITYDDLTLCAKLSNQMRDIEERIARIEVVAEQITQYPTHDSIQQKGIHTDRVGNCVSKLVELRDDLCRVAEAWACQVLAVEDAISKLQNADHQRVLRLRYVDGLPWDEIAEKMHYHKRWCKTLNDRALAQLDFLQKTQHTKAH